MPKKLLLFAVSFAVAASGFGTYCYLADIPLWPSHGHGVGPAMTLSGEHDIVNVVFDDPDAQGQAAYVFTCPRIRPLGGGQYEMENPQIKYKFHDGRMVLAQSRKGLILADQLTKGVKPNIRGGKLWDDVRLTFGPEASFVAGSSELQPGQIQARFDEDLHFTALDRSLESNGPLHVRSKPAAAGGATVSFDGYNMTLTFNRERKRIEYLRIDPDGKTGKIIIAGVGQSGLGLGGPETAPAGTGAGTATTVAAGPTAAPADAASSVYRTVFGQDVEGTWGPHKLLAQNLALLFRLPSNDPTAPRPPRSETAPAALTPAAPVAPMPTPTEQDVVLTWTGPMEMRPAEEGVPALGPKEFRGEATGTLDHPATYSEAGPRGDTVIRLMQGGKLGLTFLGGVKDLQMDPGDYGQVNGVDATLGKFACRQATYSRGTNLLTLQGPGHAEGDENSMGNAATAPAAATANRKILTTKWSKTLEATLAAVPDPKKPGKMMQVPRRIVIDGDAEVEDPTVLFRGQHLDLALASTGEAKQPVALEHLLATGDVFAQVHQTGPQAAFPPSSIRGHRLELQTIRAPGAHVPQPSLLTVEGDAVALIYQPDRNDPLKPVRQQIATPKLVATLEPKATEPGKVQTGRDVLGGFDVRDLEASGGVQVELEGYGKLPVVGTAQTLHANNAKKAGTALLEGTKPGQTPVQFARLQQGASQIAGASIALDQKAQSMDIPGAGDAIFEQTAAAPCAADAENPPPVHIRWGQSMHYSGKELLATFNGPIHANLLGKPDQDNSLIADRLLVKQTSSADPTQPGGGEGKIESITADGHVEATGLIHDPNGKLLQRFFITGPTLVYKNLTRTLTVPGAGKMLLEDYRPEAAAPATRAGDPLAGAGNLRGQTAFTWQESLTYQSQDKAGVVQLKKDVQMVHLPSKALRLPGAKSEPVAAGAPIRPINLVCQELTAQLLADKTAVSNPVGLGQAGQTRLSKFTAREQTQLELDHDTLAGIVLEYDADSGWVTASGNDRNPAVLVRQGAATVAAEKFEANLRDGALKTTHVYGNVVGGSGALPGP